MIFYNNMMNHSIIRLSFIIILFWSSSNNFIKNIIPICNAFTIPKSSTSTTTKSSFKLSKSLTNNDNNNINNNNDMDDAFDIFVAMRTGLHHHHQYKSKFQSNVVYWTGYGELYESPSGTLLANVDGFEVSKAVYLNDNNHNQVRIFSRKIFWYRDPITNEILKEYNGQPVQPIKYDWQVFDLERGNVTSTSSTSSTAIESSSLLQSPVLVPIHVKVVRSPRVTPLMPITGRIAGSPNQLIFQVPLFIDIEIPVPSSSTSTSSDKKGNNMNTNHYRAWEFYDYYVDTSLTSNGPPTLSWTRNGDNPPFIENGNGVMHFQGYRVNTFDELPDSVKVLVKEEYPLFAQPPLDMEEIDELIEGMTAMDSIE